MAALVTGTGTTATTPIEESPIDLESPDITGHQIAFDARQYIIDIHEAIRRAIEKRLANRNDDYTWRVASIEERNETLYDTLLHTRRNNEPMYVLHKALATFDIIAVENGPVVRIDDNEQAVAIAKRKLRLKAELQHDGTLKIVESEVDAPKRRYL
jgi:hypothetical protein